MRFRVRTREQKWRDEKARLQSWHKWFAWKPVRMTSDKQDMRIFEFVYRKGIYDPHGHSTWVWRYASNTLDILKIKEDDEE